MDTRSARTLISRELRDFGFWLTLYDVAFRAANHVLPLMVLNSIVLETPCTEYFDLPAPYRARFLDGEQMRAYISPENNIDEDVVNEAIENGDRCMVILDQGTIASYGWYSNQPTDFNKDLRIRFKDGYVYMYKGFTKDEYRGQRLHAIGMTLALQEYLQRGFRGVVSVVLSHNFSSLKSCYRIGYRDFGKIYVAKMFGHYFIHHSRGCQDYDFLLESKPVSETDRRSVVKAA